MYGYDAAHRSYVPSRGLPPATADAHRFSQTGTSRNGGGSTEAPPAIGDGVAYIAGDVRIEARDIETEERLWEIDPEDSVATSPVLACGVVYVTTLNETLALDPTDGSVVWRAEGGAPGDVSASPVAVDDRLYVATGGVAALDAETGSERWHASTEHVVQGVAVDDRVYVGAASNGSGEVAAFTIDGDRWWRTTEPGQVYTTPVVTENTVYAVSKTGTVTALAATDGHVRWQESVEPGVFQPPALANDRIVVGAGNGTQTIALDATTGERLWTYETGVSKSAPVVVGDRVLATGANTGIYLLDAATGDRVRHWATENVGSQPVVAYERLFYRAWNVSDVFVIKDTPA
ncbi:outer membrane protein assembly factor BamB family protein [Halegenticoccus soli]|uniref:outer membrane protein assembly factor BamB family protein n=1 Tax=Halegenticoccus soli TaxID=1985678 RepID=UPI0013046A7E|nr:PQQ-binding-like beta-propeller repeat protein [Halegenticoccus soli]